MTDSDLMRTRWETVAQRLRDHDVDALVVTTGFDLVYLTGYNAHWSERLTAWVGLPKAEAQPVLFAPMLEVPGVPKSTAFSIEGWTDDDDPVSLVVKSIKGAARVLVSDEMWAHYLLRLKAAMPETEFISLSDGVGGLRSVKSAHEMQAIQTVGGLADEIASQIQRGDVPLIGRTEAEIQADVTARLFANGHETVEFCIVASGPNSASPHHNASDRVVQQDEMVLFDFGGKHEGYCSDITRCVWTGEVPDDVASAYATLKAAQQAAFEAATPGATLGAVDAAARDLITDAGFGEQFIHRTGHGIGTEVHEQPYVKAGSNQPIEVGHAFSIEPGIYIDGKWGMRLEDIVVIDAHGAVRCSTTDHNLVSVTV